MAAMHVTVVPPPELRREPTEVGEAFSFGWMEIGHLGLAVAAIVMAVIVCAVGDAVRRDPGDIGLIVSVLVLLLADLTMVWSAAAGLLNRTTMTFEPDCMWLRHGPVAVIHRGRVYGRRELQSFGVREIEVRSGSADSETLPSFRYVLTAATADGRTLNLTRKMKPYYFPALTYLAYHGNHWLGVVAEIHEAPLARVASH